MAAPSTLFGMNTPSLDALGASESAVGARAAVAGTFADWAHTPDFLAGMRSRSAPAGPCR